MIILYLLCKTLQILFLKINKYWPSDILREQALQSMKRKPTPEREQRKATPEHELRQSTPEVYQETRRPARERLVFLAVKQRIFSFSQFLLMW